jgi:predicted CxxxxCH...CXXCH cytochrome family protein
VWNPATGTCSNLYCHGYDGKDNGRVVHTAKIGGCKSCHPDSTAVVGWLTKMSGEHSKHLFEGLGCEECHAATVSSSSHVSDVTQHVDGEADTRFPSGMNYSGGTCTGECHGETHSGRSWR